MEDTSQQVGSGIAVWMECVTVTLFGRYFTAGGQWYCSLNGVCYSEHCMEDTSSRWTVVLQFEWSALWWMLYERYCTGGGQWYCSLNVVCYSEPYMEDTSQRVDSVISAWMECVVVNIMWKILHSRWTVVLQLEWSVLQWTLFERYFTAGGQCYCSLNGVRFSEHYLEDTSQQVDSGIAAWMECATVNIIWKILHSQVDKCIAAWMDCGTLNLIWKVLHSRWTVVLQLEWSAF